MGALPEAELYGLLLAEACGSLPGLNLARHIAVTPDQSRYKRHGRVWCRPSPPGIQRQNLLHSFSTTQAAYQHTPN